jgi:tRNA/tmRNA/rRNA uracil-C5-methylase (TrmA/RlmC/RlmD family)
MATPTFLRIDGWAHGGRGVARLDGKAVFVAGALPGELVEAEIHHDHKRYSEARVTRVVEPAEGRVAPPCPFVPDCGGCDLQHAAPSLQRQLKTRVVREQLERLGGQDQPIVRPCRAVGPDLAYRSNIQVHSDPEGRLGFHRAGSHEVVPIDRCLVATDDVNDLLAGVGTSGGATTVGLRANGPARTVILEPGPGAIEPPTVAADVQLLQPDGTAVGLRGTGELTETVRDITYRFGPTDFFQVNIDGAAAIVDTVLDVLGDVRGQLCWDLYAGVGLLTVPLALAGAEVVAVETAGSAVEHARANAEAAGVTITAEQGSVSEFVARPAHVDDPPEVVVLDPPRDGAGRGVCEALADLAVPVVIYVSCDPASLARDVRTLTDRGYRLVEAIPLDLFPMTHHVEAVAHLAR